MEQADANTSENVTSNATFVPLTFESPAALEECVVTCVSKVEVAPSVPYAWAIIRQVYFGNVTVGTDNITVPVDNPLSTFTNFLVFTRSSLVEQTSPAYHSIVDAFASVTDVYMVDKDLDANELGCLVSWTPPDDEKRVDTYSMYLSTGTTGLGRSQIGGETPVGANQAAFPPETYINNHIIIYTKSTLVEQTTPVSLALVSEPVFLHVSYLLVGD